MELQNMTIEELENLRFRLDCEVLERKGFFDSFDTQIQAEELRYRHSYSLRPEPGIDYVEF